MASAKEGGAYVGAAAIVAGVTVISALLWGHVESSDLTMLYLLGVVAGAIAFGRGPAIFAALLSVALFDFLFVPPRFTFRVSDVRYLVTFSVMLVVAVITGTLTARLREQRERALLRERRVTSLQRLSQDLALRSSSADVMVAAVARIRDELGFEAAALLPEEEGRVSPVAGSTVILDEERERAAAQSAFEQGRPIGFPFGPAPAGVRGLHIPLIAGTKVNGVLSVSLPEGQDAEHTEMIRAFSSLTALALERCRLAEDSRRAQAQVEIERARNALLSSVSHDLRTPLAAITGAASALRDDGGEIEEVARRDLADTISEEADRLNRLIANLLEMTRVESGTLRVKKEWHSLEEVIGAALARSERELADREVRVVLPPTLPLVPVDDVLFEQVIRNLIENANKYSPPGEPIEIGALTEEGELQLEVGDRGVGLAAGEERLVFDKFYRGRNAIARPGAGLGLAICRGIVEAHGGRITAERRTGGGSVFRVILPIEGSPPEVEAERVSDEERSDIA